MTAAAERGAARGARTEERLARAIAFGLLPGALVFGGLIVPTVQSQWDDAPPVWTVASFVAVLLPCVVAGAFARRLPVRAVRGLATTSLVAALACTASLPLVMRLHDGQPPWVRDIVPIGVIAGLLAVDPVVLVGAAVLEAVLLGVGRAAVDGALEVSALQDALYSLLFQVVFIALGAAVLGAGRAADEAETAAQEASAAGAADAARERERARVNALVHDRVLATLLLAANRTPGAEDLVRGDAARALRDLRAMIAPETAPGPVAAQELVWALQAVTTELAPDAVFGQRLHPDAPPVPGEVAETLAAAAEEALRNSLRHSGAQNRTVHVEVGSDDVCVEILDDGAGFDPRRVPDDRLGVAESILARVRALPGGDAVVVSAPGVGTRVRLHVRIPERAG